MLLVGEPSAATLEAQWGELRGRVRMVRVGLRLRALWV